MDVIVVVPLSKLALRQVEIEPTYLSIFQDYFVKNIERLGKVRLSIISDGYSRLSG